MLVLISFVVLLSGTVMASVGRPTYAGQTENVVGDCSKAQPANAVYLFLVSTPDGLPMPNVTITANGINEVTNSSGVAVLPAATISSFEARVAGTGTLASMGEYEPPVLCSGNSYYRLVSLSINATNGTDP